MRNVKKSMIAGAAALLLVTAGATRSEAAPFTLTHGNSVVDVETEDDAGVYNWRVDGIDQLFQQWFWYRIGETGPEFSLDELTGDRDDDSTFQGTRGLTVTRGSSTGLEIAVDYRLTGGTAGSGVSSLGEEISIINNSQSSMTVHFFQYSDFDLAGTVPDDLVELVGAGYNTARQRDGDGGSLTETVVTPGANRREAAYFNSTLSKLNDGDADILNDNLSAGPGDVTWAYQWDFDLSAGQGVVISKNKRIGPVPEPASLVMFGLGLLGTAAAARRRKVLATTTK